MLLKRGSFLVCLLAACLLCSQAFAREKVILDTDMVEAFDDGVAMVMLANAPNIELLGVTTLSGNSWADEGVAYALRQLEIEEKDIPVAGGLQLPLRPQRHETFEAERILCGMGHDQWVGSFGYPAPDSWRSAYVKRYNRQPSFAPDPRHGVDFIIDAVRQYPGQVTIAAIGPCGNLALAVRKAPDIVPLIKRVIYMGGSFFQPGNVTPAAEFNWWFDPESARMAVRSAFKEQIVLGLDVCEKVVFRREHYDRLLQTLGNGAQAGILRSTFVGKNFEENPEFTHFVWDVLVAAVLIDPSIVVSETTCHIDVNTDFGLSYGQSLAYPKSGPIGTQPARIITDIDQERFWSMVNDKTYWASLSKVK